MSFNRNKNHVNIMFERLLRKQGVVKKAGGERGGDFEFSSRKSKVALRAHSHRSEIHGIIYVVF